MECGIRTGCISGGILSWASASSMQYSVYKVELKGNAGNWQQQVGGGMGVMSQQPQQPQQHQSPTQPQNFGMLPTQPGNFDSPVVPQQQWNAAGGSMQYPFPTAPSPGGTLPQQQQISSAMMDASVVGDFDFSSWTNPM